MDKRQKEFYLQAMGKALALATGQRNEDYNKGGVDLRDYWEVNGMRAPLQMVDMKVKRALSQLGAWDRDHLGRPMKPSKAQVEAILESMADAINYAAFAFGEAAGLYEDVMVPGTHESLDLSEGKGLADIIKAKQVSDQEVKDAGKK